MLRWMRWSELSSRKYYVSKPSTLTRWSLPDQREQSKQGSYQPRTENSLSSHLLNRYFRELVTRSVCPELLMRVIKQSRRRLSVSPPKASPIIEIISTATTGFRMREIFTVTGKASSKTLSGDRCRRCRRRKAKRH